MNRDVGDLRILWQLVFAFRRESVASEKGTRNDGFSRVVRVKMTSEIMPFVTKYFNYLSIAVISYVVLIELYKWSTRRTAPSDVFTESDESTDPSESSITAREHSCAYMHIYKRLKVVISDVFGVKLMIKKRKNNDSVCISTQLATWQLDFYPVVDKC